MEKNDMVKVEKNELLDIFKEEKDIKGTDLLAMSDFFDVCIGKIKVNMFDVKTWNSCVYTNEMLGGIATALKTGFDITKMGMLVADSSHFSQEIIENLRAGVYHIGSSKEVAGNFRPAILDKNEQLVKFFTLKRAGDFSSVLMDITALSIQLSLCTILSQIKDLEYEIKEIVDFNRRSELSKPFLNARDKIMLAVNANDKEQKDILNKADEYLADGLNALYLDIHAQVKKLAKQDSVFAKIKIIDTLLSYIIEDMQMISKYVGLRVYLFYYRGKYDDANRIFDDYQYQLRTLVDTKIDGGKYTAMELIHNNCRYSEKNINFWLEQPKQMLDRIDSYKKALDQMKLGTKKMDVFYIDVEK